MKYQSKDIPIKEVLQLQQIWTENNHNYWHGKSNIKIPYTYEILGIKYGSENLVFSKMEKLYRKGYLEYGTSLRTSWLTDKGREYLLNN
jgi:hypothetical protein